MDKFEIKYPYIPQGKDILYVSESDIFINHAKSHALEFSLDDNFKTGACIVMDGEVIGLGANGSNYHKEYGCERVKRGIPTGEGYELCEGCHPKNHAEAKAILNAIENGKVINNADLYLWGHYWCCSDCWDKMIQAGIKDVYLLENSHILFDKNHPDNILGESY